MLEKFQSESYSQVTSSNFEIHAIFEKIKFLELSSLKRKLKK
jgi:hypothetical protein